MTIAVMESSAQPALVLSNSFRYTWGQDTLLLNTTTVMNLPILIHNHNLMYKNLFYK